jgi:hypothetical protein
MVILDTDKPDTVMETSSFASSYGASSSDISMKERVVGYFLAILATLHFLRSYFVINTEYLDYANYENGVEKMPYQGRFLMALVFRLVHSSESFNHLAARLRAPFNTPEILATIVVNLLSIGLIAIVITALYRRVQPSGRLPWLPYFLMLWMFSETYVVRSQQAGYMPYDIFAVALFTLAVYFCYTQQYVPLSLVFVVACINRETILMIIPLLLINWIVPKGPGRRRWREPVLATVLLCFWIAVHVYVQHRFAGNPTEACNCIQKNLKQLANPAQWPQIASAGGFLFPLPFLFWSTMRDRRFRLYSLIIPMWIAIMLKVGLVGETRVFGELIGFLAVYSAILFERLYLNPGSIDK